MRPLVLLVEDNDKERQLRAQLLNEFGFHTISVGSRKEAENELQACPSLDLLVTDINLNSKIPRDKSGVELAKTIREGNHALPIIGYSGRFTKGDLAGVDPKLFTSTYVKGASKLEQQIEDWKAKAIAYQASKSTQAQSEIERILKSYKISEYDAELLKEFLPKVSAAKSLMSIPTETDELGAPEVLLAEAGYLLKFISRSEAKRLLDTEEGEIVAVHVLFPVSVWIRSGEGFVVAEVVNFPMIYASSSTEDDALRQLLILMIGYFQDLRDSSDESLSATNRRLRDFLKSVFSKK
jgi:CheY-like chemotaxis protein